MEKHTKDGSLLTAEKFLPKNENGRYSRNEVEKAMIEFSKMHVEAALKEASEKGEARYDVTFEAYQSDVDKDSILNSYSLENIQ